MSIPIEQKQLLIGCDSRKVFFEKFELAFKGTMSPTTLYTRAASMWNNRSRHLEEVKRFADAKNTIMIPARIKREASAKSLSNDDEMGAKIYNQLLYIGELLREQNDLFAKLAKERNL